MPLPSMKYDVASHKWVIKGYDGVVIAKLSKVSGLEALYGVTMSTSTKIGASGTALASILKTVGTSPLTQVTASLTSLATLSGSHAVAVGDLVFLSQKATFTVAGIGYAGVEIPTTNTICVRLANVGAAIATQAALGWDVLAIKPA